MVIDIFSKFSSLVMTEEGEDNTVKEKGKEQQER